jgi:RNA polymerase primary sigma factor
MADFDYGDPLARYLRELQTVEPLSEDEERELWKHVRNRDEMAENSMRRLVEANLYLVVPIARRYVSSGFSMLDSVQEGNRGLIDSIDTYPAGSSESFSDHASHCIERSILKAIARLGAAG